MIAITERAKKALLAKKRDAGVVDLEVALRLASAPDGTLVLMLDWPRPGDHVVTYKESTVLLADPDTAAFMTARRTVDCRRTTGGRVQIVVRNRHLGGGARLIRGAAFRIGSDTMSPNVTVAARSRACDRAIAAPVANESGIVRAARIGTCVAANRRGNASIGGGRAWRPIPQRAGT